MRILSDTELTQVSGGTLMSVVYPVVVNDFNALVAGMQAGNFHGTLNLFTNQTPAGASQTALNAYNAFMGSGAEAMSSDASAYRNSCYNNDPTFYGLDGNSPFPNLLAQLQVDLGNDPFSSNVSNDIGQLDFAFSQFLTALDCGPDVQGSTPNYGSGWPGTVLVDGSGRVIGY
jgi:hypothetical protein